LLIILLPSLFQNLFTSKKELTKKDNETLSLEVHGMSCSGCSSKVKSKLLELSEIKEVEINLEAKKVEIIGDKIDKNSIITIITNLGYKIIDK
jgi:copper chaperone CopZ